MSADLLLQCGFSLADDRFKRVLKGIYTMQSGTFLQPLAAKIAGRHQTVEVSFQHIGETRITGEDPHNFLISDATMNNPYRRDHDTLLENRSCGRADRPGNSPADIP